MGGSLTTEIVGSMTTYNDLLRHQSQNIGSQADPNASTVTANIHTVASNGHTTGVGLSTPRIYMNRAAEEQIRTERSNAGYAATIDDFMGEFDRVLGQPGTINSLTNQVARLQMSFARFSARPENSAARNEVITMAQGLADTFTRIETELQRARQNAENEIEKSVDSLHTQLDFIRKSNLQIESASNSKATLPGAEDRRRAALNEIATLLNVRVDIDGRGIANVTGPNNINLLRAPSLPLSFASSPTLGPSSTYPGGGLNGIMVGTQDITGQLGEGRLKALFTLRDKIFPGLSEQFSQIAEKLKTTLNETHNAASSYPGATELVGSRNVTGAETLFGAGQFRIAALNGEGVIQTVGTVNLAGLADINAVVAAMNTQLGVGGTASVDANGHVKIVAANGNRIAINENTSQVLPSNIKVQLYNQAGAAIGGAYNYNTQALGSLGAIVTQMNTDFGVNARAELVGNKIHISALGTNQVSLDDYPKTFGSTVQGKGVSHYFGLNNFFEGETSVTSPHVSGSLRVNPDLVRDPNLLSHGVLSLTAAVGATGVTQQGLPNAAGKLPAHLYQEAFTNRMQFFSTVNFAGKKMGFQEYVSATMGYVGAEIEDAQLKREVAESQRDNFMQSYEKKSRKSMRELIMGVNDTVQAIRGIQFVLSQNLKLERNLVATAG